MTPVLAASTLIVMGDVVEDVDLDGKEVIFVYPIVGHRHGKNVMNNVLPRGIKSTVRKVQKLIMFVIVMSFLEYQILVRDLR